MNQKTKKAVSVVATALVVAGAVIYLLVSGFDDTVVYYKTVDELLADPGRFETRAVRINGVLVPGSIKAKPGTKDYLFQITKRNQVLEVAYSGILPDTMLEDKELVVEGVYNQAASRFQASEILTKCPSKYESQAQAIK
jgi:cytochrome c-type biogenesis protein CcmE